MGSGLMLPINEPFGILLFQRSRLYIVGAKRTVFGTFGGKLKDHNATDLASAATVAALKAAKVTPEQVDSVICGNVSSVSIDSILKKQRHNS